MASLQQDPKGGSKLGIKGDINYEIKKLFRTRRSPPTSKLLEDFEDKIWNLVTRIEFKKYPNRKNPYLRNINDKIKELMNHQDVVLFSDKTRTIYRIKPRIYDKVLQNELCKKYKIVEESFLTKFDINAKLIMEKLDLSDRTEPFVPKHLRITLKDHKLNFITNPTVRLIFPNSSDLGKVSKNILGKIYNKIEGVSEFRFMVQYMGNIQLFQEYRKQKRKEIYTG